MKKKLKKLRLDAITIRLLGKEELTVPAGGTNSICSFCDHECTGPTRFA